MKEIEYATIIANYDQMINALEFDSMRSAGKAKMNCGQVESMYNMRDRYVAMLAKMKPTPTKKEG